MAEVNKTKEAGYLSFLSTIKRGKVSFADEWRGRFRAFVHVDWQYTNPDFGSELMIELDDEDLEYLQEKYSGKLLEKIKGI